MRSLARATTLLLAAALCLAPLTAAADQDDEARIHYEAGEQYYVRGQYALAIREFEEAYRLAPAPALLYNIAQSYERNGQFQRARDNLARYIDSGAADPAEVPVLEDKLAAIDARIEAEKHKPRRPFKTAKWIVGGLGIALTGAAVYFALDASAMQDDIEAAGDGSMPIPWDDELESKQSRGDRSALLGKLFGAAGGALLVTGVIFFTLDLRAAGAAERAEAAAPPALSAAPLLGPGLAGGVVRWRF
jgi:tetratricopeptide (TPR) repeat protein